MNEKVLARLLTEYEQAEQRLSAIVAQYITMGIEDEMLASTWAAQKLAQVKQLAADTRAVLIQLKGLDPIAAQLVIDAYREGLKIIPDGLVGTNVAAAELLAQDLVLSLQASRPQILRRTVDAYRQIIGNVESQTLLGVATRIEAARKALAQFADKGIIGFTDASGKQWDMRSYVSMATRTATINALREGRLAGLEANDKDLIIVRTGPRYCELCAPYKNKVLSISGKDSKYTSLENAKSNGLYHPNCRCTFAAYTPGLTIVRSNDTIENNYDKEQDLRYSERQVRKWKRRLEVATTDADIKKAKGKVKDWRDTAKEIADTEDLVYKSNRFSNRAAR